MTAFAAGFEAIGVVNEIVVDREDALAPGVELARAEVDALDAACSRFREDSELAAVNRAAGAAVRVGPFLLDAVEAALRAAAATGGLVDPTVGRALVALGYDRDFKLLSGRDGRVLGVAAAAGWRRVRVDRARGTLTIPAGAALDLGAVAKAFAADRIAALVRATTGSSVLVSLGGDVSVAGAPAGGWPVRVVDDRGEPDPSGQTVAIFDGGLATSSVAVRRWRAGGRARHHIVDPQTGRPADAYWRTVSVAAASCADANAAATAAVVRGEPALAWLEELGLAARLVRVDGTVATTPRWP